MTGHKAHRLRHAIVLIAAVGLHACADEELTAPDSFVHQATDYTHYTGPQGCTTWESCLLDNVQGGWEGTVAGHSTYSYTIVNAVTPTSKGSVITAEYVQAIKSTGNIVYQGPPACWFRSNAYFPDARVIIQGRNVDCSYTYFTFTSYAQIPVPEVLEFERPDSLNCTLYDPCAGPFRIKIDLAGSGWFGYDETRIYVQNAAGTSNWQQYGTMSIDGSTVQWTFSSLWYPGSGSRIRIVYQPWGVNRTDDLTNLYLPFDAPAPNLTLTADPTEVQVPSEFVTFTASAAGASLLEVADWTWVPDDTTTASLTVACSAGDSTCVTAVYESGTMHVTGNVDGQTRSDSAHVQLQLCPPEEPFLADSAVVEGLRELWYYSYPDSAVNKAVERMGWIINDNGTYHVDWVPRNADVCAIHDPADPHSPPSNAVAWVHTHPGLSETVPADTCLYVDIPVTLGSGPSWRDYKYHTTVESALGRPIPGYILEDLGLVRFDSASRIWKYFPLCNEWQTDAPIFTGD